MSGSLNKSFNATVLTCSRGSDDLFDEASLLTYDEATLDSYIDKAPQSDSDGGVRFLSPGLVSKFGMAEPATDGLKAIELARQLGVRVPAIKRSFEMNDGCLRIVMERIDGENLFNCWTSLSWFTTIGLAFQLRRFVRNMRMITSSTAGGLSSGNCESIWIDDMYQLPSHASTTAVAAFFNFWANYIPPPVHPRPQTTKRENRTEIYSPNESLVFTHQDLALRNLMVDKKGQLWVVDWQSSGFYPTFLEYVGMHNFQVPLTWKWLDKLRFYLFSWISVGRYPAEQKVMVRGRWLQAQYQYARRSEVLIEGAGVFDVHSRKPGL